MVDDDKIDELVDELSQTNKNLSRLVDSIVRGQEQQREDSDEPPRYPVDNVIQGRYSPTVDSIVDYQDARERAANDDSTSLPTYSGPQDRVEFYVDAFTSSLENIDMIENRLSKDRFDEFVRRLAVYYGANEELVEILEPSHGFFGFDVDKDGKVFFAAGKSHIDLLQAMDSYWHIDRDSNLNPNNITRPWEALRIGSPEQRENINEDFTLNVEEFLRYSVDTSAFDVDVRMAELIQRRGGMQLPQHLKQQYNL